MANQNGMLLIRFCSSYIGFTRKNEQRFVKNFLGDNKTEFIEILHTVILRYYEHFYKVSKRSVANYVSIVKFKITSQKMQYQSKIHLFQSMLNVTSILSSRLNEAVSSTQKCF